MKRFFGLVVSFVLLSGCGSDGGGKSKVTLDTAQQTQVVTSSKDVVKAGVSLNELKTDAGSGNAFSSLGNIYGSASQLWGTKMAATGGGFGAARLLETQLAGLTGCYTESGGTVTYDCNEGGTTIKGTIVISGDNIKIDLTITNAVYSMVYDGDVTVTTTQIDGYIGFQFEQNAGGYATSYDIQCDYNAVVLDTAGCPIGGSLYVDVNIESSGMPGGYNVTYPNVEVVFGPACGDVTMY